MTDSDHNSNYAFVGVGIMLSVFIILGSYFNDKKVGLAQPDQVDA